MGNLNVSISLKILRVYMFSDNYNLVNINLKSLVLEKTDIFHHLNVSSYVWLTFYLYNNMYVV